MDNSVPPVKVYNVQDLERRRSPDFKTIYSSNAASSATFYDITVTFGQIIAPLEKGSSPYVEDSASVTMSPELAKALHGLLAGLLETYEKQSGAIRQLQTASKSQA